MKKVLTVALLAVALASQAADDADKNFFNHLSVGVNAGTPGVGIDVAMPICDYVSVRAGVSVMPDIKVTTDLDINAPSDYGSYGGYDIPDEAEIEGKVGFTNGKVLFDIYPFKASSFHITAGAYFGSSKVIKAYNTQDGLLLGVTKFNEAVDNGTIPYDKIGVELDDYLLEPDENGNVDAYIKTSSFKPYLGLGMGRAVPKKRLGFMFELGVQFWGSPKVYCQDKELTESNVGGDGGGIIKTISKVSVYPVLNFRLCYRIF